MRSKIRGLLHLRGWWLAIARVRDDKIHIALDVEHAHPRPAFTVDLSLDEAFEIEEALHEARTGHALPHACDHDAA